MTPFSARSVGVLIVVVTLEWPGEIRVAGRASAATAQASEAGQPGAYRGPRTPDGQPDLQGFWTNQTYTPLERRDEVGATLDRRDADEGERGSDVRACLSRGKLRPHEHPGRRSRRGTTGR